MPPAPSLPSLIADRYRWKPRPPVTPLLELLASPWHQALDRLLASVRDELVLVSPFITRAGTERVLDGLACAAHVPPPIHVITDLSVASLLDGSLDPAAIVDILDFSPSSVVSIAPRLHAKAYIADTNLAIITSANLTQSGLYLNKEYGVLLRDRKSSASGATFRHMLVLATGLHGPDWRSSPPRPEPCEDRVIS